MKTLSKVLAVSAFTIALIAVLKEEEEPLETVDKVDLKKYLGKWYEIAAFPQSFETGCTHTTATYSLNEDGSIRVQNCCIKNGGSKNVTGKAFVANSDTNAKLNVRFFWPFTGKYWIIALAPDYSYAMVGHPNRRYLWILSRTAKMDSNIYKKLIKKAEEQGFNTARLKQTVQA